MAAVNSSRRFRFPDLTAALQSSPFFGVIEIIRRPACKQSHHIKAGHAPRYAPQKPRRPYERAVTNLDKSTRIAGRSEMEKDGSPLSQGVPDTLGDGMQLELISIATDREPLDGIYYTPEEREPLAVVLIFHGNCHNFYTGPSRFLPPILTRHGFACLAFNRRGHDMVTSLTGRSVGGGSFQLAAEGIADNRAAAAWVKTRGFADPICIGHSNGGMLGVKHSADNQDTRALVLMSAHMGGKNLSRKLSASGLFAKNRFDEITAQAETMVAQGRGHELILLPDWWWVISAESFLDRSRNTPDILEEAPNVRCPTLFLRGDQEPPEMYPAEQYAVRSGGPCEVRIVPNCNHFYHGHETDISESIAAWLKQTCNLS